jgi:hypothetical protein
VLSSELQIGAATDRENVAISGSFTSSFTSADQPIASQNFHKRLVSGSCDMSWAQYSTAASTALTLPAEAPARTSSV